MPLIAVAALGLTGAPSAHASPGMSRPAHVSADLQGPPWDSSVALAADSSGLLEAFGTSNAIDNQPLYVRQTGPGDWTNALWHGFGGELAHLAAATNQNGLVELVGVNSDGAIFHRVQTSPGDWTGSGWVQFATFSLLF